MVQENSGSSMEMGTSDQVLVATKRRKSITYILGAVAMLIAVGVVVTLVVLLSGNENGTAEPIISSTEGPTTIVPVSTSTTTTTTTTATPETPPPEPPTPPPGSGIIELEDVISGKYATASFNGSWTPGSEILFRTSGGDLVTYDVDTNTTTLLVSNTSQILQQSSRVTQLSSEGTHVVLAYNAAAVYRYTFIARYAVIDTANGNVTDIVPPGLPAEEAVLQNFVWGPSGTALAFVYLNNIFYQSSLTSEPQQITRTGQLNIIYHGIPDWVYEEEVFGSNNAIWFSGDGNKLAFVTFDDSRVRVMRVPHYGLPGSVDYQYTKHHEIRYPKPGTTNPTVTVTLRDLVNGAETLYEAPESLFQPIIKTVRFVSNDTIALMWTNRGQTSMLIQTCTLGSPICTEIFSYTEEDGWIDNNPLIFNEQGDSFITVLPQAVDGVRYKQVVQVSQGGSNETWSLQSRSNTPHTVLEILTWTPEDTIWYKATHVDDPSQQHIYSLAPSLPPSCFSCSVVDSQSRPCLFNEGQLSQDGTKIALNCAGPNVPQQLIYSTESGSLLRLWDDNAAIAAEVSSRALPRTLRLSVPLADLPDALVQIQVPEGYETRTDVPLLVYVYGGPDTALVSRAWAVDWGSSLVSRWGVAVAHIDGRGSGLRGVDTMFAVNRRLATHEIHDQINITRHLQSSLGWVDANRTCIWGWSYGGYAASLALARGGDVFRCAAAVAPVVDWRFYDTIYTERYMDTPQVNHEAYVNSSLLTEQVVEAFRHKRYMLIHGTADDNVHYQHSMLLSRLLQTRDVYFTQMSYTDEDHGLIGVRPHLYHSLERFLEENML